MNERVSHLLIGIFWLVSMSWLVVTKWMPFVNTYQLPTSQLIGPGTDVLPTEVKWRIEYEDETIGTATTSVQRPSDGTPYVHSVVRLRNFPLGEILDQYLGVWGHIARSLGLPDGGLRLSVEVRTRMHFSPYGEMQLFYSEVDLDDYLSLIQIRGTLIEQDRLQIIVVMGDGLPAGATPPDSELIRQEIRIAPGSLVVDGFTPHPRLADLRVGQEWTMRSIRPFSPKDPMHLVHAKVERQELVAWDREMETMFVVALRDIATSSLTTADDQAVRLWVRADGMVVRQQLQFGSLEINFYRVP